MTRAEQVEFLRVLTKRLVAEMTAKIEESKIPADWDGHELRSWLAVKVQSEESGLMCNRRGKRFQDFKRHLTYGDSS